MESRGVERYPGPVESIYQGPMINHYEDLRPVLEPTALDLEVAMVEEPDDGLGIYRIDQPGVGLIPAQPRDDWRAQPPTDWADYMGLGSYVQAIGTQPSIEEPQDTEMDGIFAQEHNGTWIRWFDDELSFDQPIDQPLVPIEDLQLADPVDLSIYPDELGLIPDGREPYEMATAGDVIETRRGWAPLIPRRTESKQPLSTVVPYGSAESVSTGGDQPGIVEQYLSELYFAPIRTNGDELSAAHRERQPIQPTYILDRDSS